MKDFVHETNQAQEKVKELVRRYQAYYVIKAA
jgi:hypothetical protein